ncbi:MULTISPECIES: ROK family protein [Streptomyces]|uniref:ROK family protein n=1 Tax=Streptomyces odorifer TaxID=53450 RepID=A0A7Y6KII1_9ACTN|nr:MULTISPECIES: ROK family protein [Streptomyces]NUV37369.1 ROK family protein [Streptomyces sp. KAI-27]NUV45256.1 ROK family protein [Streptomyces sp. CAI-78]MBL0777097.1 ROK family protein [Streptomyces albidoflavus]MBL0800002.1 ROK family protein [Streptomyces albidoflavus]MCG5120737.1 ROK family protein [Streptomyces sp. T7(2022)]
MRLVPEAAPQPSTPPAPRRLGAVELVPGQVRAAVVSMAGRVLDRTEVSYDAAGATGEDLDQALAEVAELLAAHDLQGVGVAAAGLVDPLAGLILEVNDVPALRGYPVAERLGALTGAVVRVEQRARLQVLGDRWFGAGRGRRTFASVSTGEVLGVGVLYDGEVMAPPGGRSGAHMTVSASGERCTCGSRGCWKTLATTGWLRSRARAAGLAQASLDELVRSEDAPAGQVVEEYAHNLALGLVNVQQLFAPGLFILHGEAREGGERFRTLVEERLREAVAFAGAEQPRVLVGTAAVDDVALLGGAGLVLSRL